MQAPKHFTPEPFEYHQELELTVETLTNLGIGLGRVDNWVVMVPFTLPGERVRVRVFRNYKNYSEADLVDILEASPDRVTPQCGLFGVCGGCQYQHLSYEKQLEWKTQQIRELLERIGNIKTEVSPTHPSPVHYHYRSKLTPHYPKPRKDQEVPIGFLKANQRTAIVDVPECPIATESINKALEKARIGTREKLKNKTKKRGGTLLLRHCQEGVITDPKATITERIGKKVFQFVAGEFFQNNPFILPELVDFAITRAQGEGIRYLLDAYCGVGVFAIMGSDAFEQCVGIEVNSNAIKWAQGNAGINNASNVSFLIGEAEKLFAYVAFPADETAVILDPPRKGCDEAFIQQLLAYKPKRIVYVSCGPDTQARDLVPLIEGGYSIECVQPFDLFPQTRHVENVVVLVG